MSLRVLVLVFLALALHRGTMSYVFGPLAAFTASQEASSTAPSVSTLQWAVGADADADATTTPFPRRRQPAKQRRPNPGSTKIVFPSSDDDNKPITALRNPNQTPQDIGILSEDRPAGNTEQRFSPGFMSRPFRSKQSGQGSEDVIVFDGPSSQRTGGRRRIRPSRRPLAPTPPALNLGDTASNLASPPPPCPCPTTSESNPICALVQGARVTMINLSEFKCAQICLGPTDVTLLFYGRCQKLINKLTPFIHD